ncbi:MAG: DUF3047 domain-containing protein [Alphaproteobacteria bacterium]|nr:DUF3047 domain-containing protein [Alphaproteobacteria bacterium]
MAERLSFVCLRLPAAVLPLAICGLAIAASPGEGQLLADPAKMLRTAERVDFSGSNLLTVEQTEMGMCLRSTPRSSATGLYQLLEMPSDRLRNVSWQWRVDKAHATADIRAIEREDFAAKIAFVFGEPSFFNRDVPTLAYVWTSTPVENGSIIPSRRYANLRYVQLHGAAEVGRWQLESRDILADFVAAFGQPPGALRYIAVFNDNDQTGEPVSALFGPVRASATKD